MATKPGTKTKSARRRQRELLIGIAVLLAAVLALCLAAVAILHEREARQEPEASSSTAQTLPPPAANPYGPEDFAYEGDYLTCLAGESMLGIDVSGYQQNVDWQQVAQSGVEFVMIRVGYRGQEQGLLAVDESAREHYIGAKEAGLKVGVYFYAQAVNVAEALEEAAFVLERIDGWELDMPVVYDWEYVSAEARTGQMDARTLTDCTKAFCQRIEQAGYKAMLYFNQSQGRDLLYLEELTDYGFWLAMYHEEMDYPYKLDMWQYTCTGSVPGIQGYVDINLYFPG